MSVAAERGRAVPSDISSVPERIIDRVLSTHAWLVFIFLYLPILVVVIYAFNENRLAQVWHGFSLKWFGEAFRDETLRKAFQLSVVTATVTAAVATVLGTSAAISLRNFGKKTKTAFDALMYMALIVPEIVIAIASLLFFVTINFPLGPFAIVATHAVFNTSLVTLIVRARLAGMDRSLEEASADLGATRWNTFRQVTLPQLFPAVLAGALLSFTFSFDDVILSSFVTGPGSTTLPVEIFSQLRFGLTPKINVVAVATLAITLSAIVGAQLLLRREAKRAGQGTT
jgi:spermidine/putrescine transport system permease protein